MSTRMWLTCAWRPCTVPAPAGLMPNTAGSPPAKSAAPANPIQARLRIPTPDFLTRRARALRPPLDERQLSILGRLAHRRAADGPDTERATPRGSEPHAAEELEGAEGEDPSGEPAIACHRRERK